jgi:hypothetical protein
MPDIDSDIKTLQGYDTFIRFLSFVEILREECVSDLHDAPTEKVQQISGRILSYDQILEMTDYKSLKHLVNL